MNDYFSSHKAKQTTKSSSNLLCNENFTTIRDFMTKPKISSANNLEKDKRQYSYKLSTALYKSKDKK